MLRTLRTPPQPGSLQEWALIFLLDKLEDIEHARFRALAQVMIDKEEGAKAFEDYMHLAFPSLAKRKEKRNEEMRKTLSAWTSTGPLKVVPLQEPRRASSQMKQKSVRVEDERSKRLYGKLGSPFGGKRSE